MVVYAPSKSTKVPLRHKVRLQVSPCELTRVRKEASLMFHHVFSHLFLTKIWLEYPMMMYIVIFTQA